MNPVFYIFHPDCVIPTITLYLFLNVSTPQLTSQLMDFVCINCFIIALNVMPHESECTSKEFSAHSVVRTAFQCRDTGSISDF